LGRPGNGSAFSFLGLTIFGKHRLADAVAYGPAASDRHAFAGTRCNSSVINGPDHARLMLLCTIGDLRAPWPVMARHVK